jgi:hypothetical protein
MMTTIAAESESENGVGGCAPASKPMTGANNTNAIARKGKAIVVDGGVAFAAMSCAALEKERIVVSLARDDQMLKRILAGLVR